MASNDNTTSQGEDGDLAQAFKEISRGEQQASVIENNLTSLEKKIDELLARANEDQKNFESIANNSKAGSRESQADTKEAVSKDAIEK